jgi:hypothetical protein
VFYFLVIHNNTANPTDWAEFIAKRYGAAESTISFIAGPARYNCDQNITMTIFCTMNNPATITNP